VKNEVLHKLKEERNTLHPIKQRKAKQTGHIFNMNCLLKHASEEQIEGTRIQGRRCKQLLDDLKETRRYWNLKEEVLYRTV
jgi:hypothetical protein